MQMIIDIPDNEYKQNKHYYDSVYHGIPLDDVLDKITAEIDEKLSHYEHFSSSNTANGLTIAKKIIEKYKGDSEC